MAHAIKKIYREHSPGDLRRKNGTTLTRLRKLIAASDNKTRERRRLHELGLLGDIAA